MGGGLTQNKGLVLQAKEILKSAQQEAQALKEITASAKEEAVSRAQALASQQAETSKLQASLAANDSVRQQREVCTSPMTKSVAILPPYHSLPLQVLNTSSVTPQPRHLMPERSMSWCKALIKISLDGRMKNLLLLAGSPAEGGEGRCRRKGSLGGRAGAGRQQGSSIGGGHSAAAGGCACVGGCQGRLGRG